MTTTSPGSRVRIEFAQASDPGRDPNKQVNEDSCGYADTKLGHLLVLCDGMGGHYGGKEASRAAITTIFEMMERAPAGTVPGAALKAAIEEAGRRVYQLGGPPENRTRPGSTVVSLLMHDGGLDVAHVGDSRGYIIRANQIYPLTRDHSMVQAMIDAGMLTEQQAMGHPDANKITRALGMKPDVDVELRPEPMDLFAGDIVLLSSDGLTDLALAQDILGAVRQALASGGVESACKILVDLANNRGGHDNITVQMARVSDVPSKARATIPQSPPSSADAGPASQAAGQQRPHETYTMTAPEPGQQGAYATPPAAPSPAGLQQSPQAAQQWAPVPPTATDLPPNARMAMGPGPTVPEQPPQGAAPWGAGAYQMAPPATTTPMPGQPGAGMGGAPGYAGQQPQNAGLAAYRLEAAGPASLPLPPPAFSPPAPTVGPTQGPPSSQMGAPGFGAPPAAMGGASGFGAPAMTAGGYGGGQPAPGGYGGGQPAPGGYGAPPPMSYGPGSSSMAPAAPARGGVVFVIIGLSVVIAVLVIVLLWALFAR